jgi:hypothetical protein
MMNGVHSEASAVKYVPRHGAFTNPGYILPEAAVFSFLRSRRKSVTGKAHFDRGTGTEGVK